MTVTTTYRGHNIQWSDNADEWVCYDLSDKVRSSPKLSLIKAAIDRLYLAERKTASTPCFELSYDGQKTASNVVEYLKAKVIKGWAGRPDTIEHRVAVVAQRRGSERPSRTEKALNTLMPCTPEAEAAYAEYERLHALEKEAEKRTRAAFDAIPRLQVADVQKLVDLASQEGATR